MSLFDDPALFCVYTIHHSDGLRAAEHKGGATWTEQKIWRSASDMLNRSIKDGTWLPVFFAAADRASGLLYVDRLDRIEIKHTNIDYTEYSFSQMTRLSQEPDISTLILLDTGKPLSNDFIRPYALCHTPIELIGSLNVGAD